VRRILIGFSLHTNAQLHDSGPGLYMVWVNVFSSNFERVELVSDFHRQHIVHFNLTACFHKLFACTVNGTAMKLTLDIGFKTK